MKALDAPRAAALSELNTTIKGCSLLRTSCQTSLLSPSRLTPAVRQHYSLRGFVTHGPGASYLGTRLPETPLCGDREMLRSVIPNGQIRRRTRRVRQQSHEFYQLRKGDDIERGEHDPAANVWAFKLHVPQGTVE